MWKGSIKLEFTEGDFVIREATEADILALAELAIKMWSNNTISELQSELLDLICSDNAVCFIKYVGMIMLKEQIHLLLDIWRGFLLRKNIDIVDMLKSFFQNAKNGQKKNVVLNLQVIAKLTMI